MQTIGNRSIGHSEIAEGDLVHTCLKWRKNWTFCLLQKYIENRKVLDRKQILYAWVGKKGM
jgi:hypothetical protein